MKIKPTAAESSCRQTLERQPVGQVHYRRATEDGRLREGPKQHQLGAEEPPPSSHRESERDLPEEFCIQQPHQEQLLHPLDSQMLNWFPGACGWVWTNPGPWPPPQKFIKSFQLNTKRWPCAFTSLGSSEILSNVFSEKKKIVVAVLTLLWKISHFLNRVSDCL